MNREENFRNEWQEMGAVDREREILLNRDQKEVLHEMIYQECKEGKKTQEVVADEYPVNKSTVSRIMRRRQRRCRK